MLVALRFITFLKFGNFSFGDYFKEDASSGPGSFLPQEVLDIRQSS